MKTIQNKINSIDALSREIDRLYERKESIEMQFNENWDHLQHNFPVLLRNSIFKKVEEKAKNSWAYSVFTIPKVQEAVGNAAEKITAKLEDVLLHWFDKFLLKKKED
jgi:hypothetical protein